MTEGAGPSVAVVGDRSLAASVEDAGADAVTGDAADVLGASPDLVVAAGDGALAALASEAPAVPVLAVGVDPGVPSVTRGAVSDVIAAALADDLPVTARRRFAASVDGDRVGTFVRDAMLTTDEPARISEYGVRSGDHRVARFRADGVVVATPAGSPGYLSDAGGPIVEPGSETLAVVPVAPFETDSDHWVLGDDAVSLAVHRDVSVVLVADGTERGTVPTDTPVSLAPAGELQFVAPGGDWKNSNGRRSE